VLLATSDKPGLYWIYAFIKRMKEEFRRMIKGMKAECRRMPGRQKDKGGRMK